MQPNKWDDYPSSLANLTLIILFSKIVEKFSKIISPNQKIDIVKDNSEYLGIFHFFEMKISKLIN